MASNKKNGCLTVVAAFFILAGIGSILPSDDEGKDETTAKQTQEQVISKDETKKQPETEDSKETEKQTETEKETESVLSEEEFKSSCLAFDYNTIARNPEDHIGENYTLTVEIQDVISESSWFSSYDKYYKAWTDDGSGSYYDHLIYLMDYQDENRENKFNILEGDIVKVYGTFNGMVETKNMLNNTKSEEVGLEIYYTELISQKE